VIGICLLVSGALHASLPAAEFTLAWEHSVEKVEWRERYRVEAGQLRIVEARIRGAGAGMEAPPGAVYQDRAWTWQPTAAAQPELRLTYSTFAGDYTICAADQCRTLRELAGPLAEGDVVTLRACP
jgi:hypothetical protein